MLTIASIMLALSVLTTSPALCKPYISVPTECGIVMNTASVRSQRAAMMALVACML